MNKKINNFSPNMLKTFDECPRKFFFKYIQKITLPQNPENFETGKKIHALANYYLKNFDIKKMENALADEEYKLWKNLKASAYFNQETVNTEYNLSCKVGDHWIGGRLDALVKTENNYTILDYKTGKIPTNPEFDYQTITYLLCADRFLAKQGGYNSLKFVYLGLKSNKESEITLNKTLKTQYENIITKICNDIDLAIQSNAFSKHDKCCTCEYKKFCE